MNGTNSHHLPQAASLPERTQSARLLVLHTPGRTFAGRVAERADPMTPAYGEAAVDRYIRAGLEHYGHRLITPLGEVLELAPLDKVAWHTGRLAWHYGTDSWRELAKPLGEDWQHHGRDPAVVFDWWDARWGTKASPLALTCGERSVNAISIGLDVLPLPDGTFTDVQVQATARLCAQLCAELGIEADAHTVLAHEDLDPGRRGTVRRGERILGIPWDPGGRWPRERFYEALVAAGRGGVACAS